jgi:hypothetical protein
MIAEHIQVHGFLRTYIYWHHNGEGCDHHPGVIDPLARDDPPDDEGHLENDLEDGDIRLLQDMYPYARKVCDFRGKHLSLNCWKMLCASWTQILVPQCSN